MATTEEIYELIDQIAQYERNPAQCPFKLYSRLASVLVGTKAQAKSILIGGESLVIKTQDEFKDMLCVKVPRTEILKSAPKRKVAALKNPLQFLRIGTEQEICGNINAERFSQGAILQRTLCQEAQKASIKHFTIPQVRAIKSEPVLHYIMDWHQAPRILDWLKEKNDILYSLHCFKRVLYCADFLQRRGVVHRDWKSDNILAANEDTIAVVDWTMAKDLSTARNLTIAGSQGGTPGYAPQKFMEGDFKQANFLDEIYLLGFVLWEFLALQKTPSLARESYTERGVSNFRQRLVEDLPDAAQATFWKATEIDEQHRYQTIREFLAAVLRIEEFFAREDDFIPTSQSLTPTLVLEENLCTDCGKCGGNDFCNALAKLIRSIR
jgi:serine/threonine protein kinase